MRRLAIFCVPAALAVCGWVAGGGWHEVAFGSQIPNMDANAKEAPSVPAGEGQGGLTASGRIASDHTVLVATGVSGRVVEFLAVQGQRVRAGQRLARVDEVEYRALRDERGAGLREAEADAKQARHDYKRTDDLRKRQTASDTEWVNAEAALARAEARVAAARAGLTLADKRLSDCAVTSPIAGIVLETHVSSGEFVVGGGGRGGWANSSIVTIADVDHLRVEVDVSEQDIARVRPGMHCIIIPDAYPDRRYTGSVERIDPSVNYSKGAVGVKVRIEHADGFVRIGGSARVEFLGD